MDFTIIYDPKSGKTYYGDPGSGQVFDPSTGQWGENPFGGVDIPPAGPGIILIPDPNLGWRQLLPGNRVQAPGGPAGYQWLDPSAGIWYPGQTGGTGLPGDFGDKIVLPDDLPKPPPPPPKTPPGTQPPPTTPPAAPPATPPPGTTPPPTTPPGTPPPGTTPPGAPPPSTTTGRTPDWWQKLIGPGFGLLSSALGLGNESGSERRLREAATAPYGSDLIQGFLPGPLRAQLTDPIIQSGIMRLGQLISQPGRLAPGVSEGILPRLAAESENIAGQYRGLMSQQSGALSRANAPLSIRTALESALNTAQERAQRGARREALTDSDLLARQDIGQIYPLLNSMLQFTSSGRGQAIPGLAQSANLAQNRNASNIGAIGTLLSTLANIDWNK